MYMCAKIDVDKLYTQAFDSVGMADCIKRGMYDAWGVTLRTAYPTWSALSSVCATPAPTATPSTATPRYCVLCRPLPVDVTCVLLQGTHLAPIHANTIVTSPHVLSERSGFGPPEGMGERFATELDGTRVQLGADARATIHADVNAHSCAVLNADSRCNIHVSACLRAL
jgi:hypothetical protein